MSAAPSGAPTPEVGRADVVLPTVPGLGALYARAAVRSAGLAMRTRLGRSRDGAALPSVTYRVHGVTADAERLSAYQHLLSEPAADTLPAGFVHVLAFPVATALLVRPDFPLPAAGMVHLANRVEQHRDIRLGEVLDVRAHAEGLRGHRSGTQVDLVTEVEVAGDVVWRGVSTYLAKGVRLPVGGPSVGDEPAERHAFVPPTPTARWRLPADLGRRYAAVSGDHNPIHLSPLTARALGFPRAIAHGMYTASRALAAVGPARGAAFTWTVRFAKPVLLPGSVAVRVAPAEREPGFDYAVWSRSGPHLTGSVVPR